MRFYGDPDWFIEVLSFMSNNCKIVCFTAVYLVTLSQNQESIFICQTSDQ